ncbi:3832_t:CDS:1, partial [Racocetra fulgida]
KSKSVKSLLKESKYSSESVKPNLSGNDNSLFEDDIVADLNKTEFEELELDEEVLTDNSQESSDSDLEGT